MLQKLTPVFFASKHSPFKIPQFWIIRPCTSDSGAAPGRSHAEYNASGWQYNATIWYLCADFPLLPPTMHQPRHLSTDNSKLPQNSTNTCSTDCTIARWAFFLNSSPRRENNKCMVVMWCWNRLQHACNYNSWFSISPWDKNFCVKDERCPSPLSLNTHVQTERASSGICPVISTAAAEVTVVAHSHLEGTYMLLFDPATLPLWSTIKRYTFAADVAEWLTFTLKQGQSKLTVGSRTRLLEDLWRSSVTPLWKRWRLSEHRSGNLLEVRASTAPKFAVRRATVPAG